MIPTPLAFLEVKEELIDANTAEFEHAEFGIGPEALDTVDVILASSEFVLMMVNTMMFESAGHQAIVGFPSVSVNVALLQDSALENGHEFSFGAVWPPRLRKRDLLVCEAQELASFLQLRALSILGPSWLQSSFHPLRSPLQMASDPPEPTPQLYPLVTHKGDAQCN